MASLRVVRCCDLGLTWRLCGLAAVLFVCAEVEAADRAWQNPAGGTFSSAGNWSGGVPGAGDIAHFGLTTSNAIPEIYTVSFTNDPTNIRFLVEDDRVTFDLNGHIYTTTDPPFPVVLGTVAGRTGSLTVTDGIVVLPFQSDLEIASTAGSRGILLVTTGGLVIGSPDLIVGLNGNGTLNIDNNGDLIASNTTLGLNSGTSGTATITGGGSSLLAAALTVGNSGSGTLNVTSGGRVDSTQGSIAANLGTMGTATIAGTGSRWHMSSNLVVGNRGNGMLTIMDGGHVENTSVTVGEVDGAGEILVSGPGSLWMSSGSVNVGFGGEGALSIANEGEVQIDGNLRVNGDTIDATIDITGGGQLRSSGASAGANIFGTNGAITVTGPDSLWINSGNLELGGAGGRGTLHITGGGQVQNTSSFLGVNEGDSPGTGQVTVSGAGSLWKNSGDVNVGYPGDATLQVTASGQVESSGTMYVSGENGILEVTHGGQVHSSRGGVGAGVGASGGTATISGTGSLWMNSGQMDVGSLGRGTLRITGGGKVFNTVATLGGEEVADRGDVTVSGTDSLWMNSGDVRVGWVGDGSLIVTDHGSVNASGELLVGVGGDGILQITSGGQVHSDGAAGLGNFGGVADVNISGSGSNWTIGGRLTIGGFSDGSANSGIGRVRIQPGGTVGIAQDTLLFADDLLSLEGGTLSTSGIDFRGGGTFQWTSGTLHIGIFDGNLAVPNGGILAPGNSAGTTLIEGSYVQQAGGALQIEIGGVAGGTQHDIVNVLGNAALGGNLQLSTFNDFIPNAGSTFIILQATGSITGAFANIANGQRLLTADGLGSFLVHYGAGSAFNSKLVVLSAFQAVLPGDYNDNGVVDAADYTIWRNHLGQNFTLTNEKPGALTPGVVDAEDYAFWKAHFGQSAGSGVGATAAIPEPTSQGLIGLAAIALACYRPTRNSGRF